MNRIFQWMTGKWIFWISFSLCLHWWGIGSLVSLSEETVSVQVDSGPTPLSTYIMLPPPVEAQSPPPKARPDSYLLADQSDQEIQAEPEVPETPPEEEREPLEKEPEHQVEEELKDPPPEESTPPEPPEPAEAKPIPERPVESLERESESALLQPPPSTEDAGAQSEESPEALVSPAPTYPRIAVRRGQEGTVLLNVSLNADGSPAEVRVAESSGFALLDREAQDTVLRKWRFESRPYLKKSFQVEIEFRLDQG